MSKEIIKPSKFGQAIVKEAENKFLNEKRNTVLSKVTGYLRSISQAEQIKENLNEIIDFNKEKIDALNNGQFNFSGVTGRIKFHDDMLNEDKDVASINLLREALRLE